MLLGSTNSRHVINISPLIVFLKVYQILANQLLIKNKVTYKSILLKKKKKEKNVGKMNLIKINKPEYQPLLELIPNFVSFLDKRNTASD